MVALIGFGDREPFVQRGGHAVVVLLDRGDVGEQHVGAGADEAAGFDAQHRVRSVARQLEVTAEERVPRRCAQHRRPALGGRRVDEGEGTLGPRTDSEAGARVRLVAQTGDDADGELAVGLISAVEAPGHRDPQIVELDHRARSPGELLGAEEPVAGELRELGEVDRMAPAPCIRVVGVGESVERELPKGLEQPVAHRSIGGFVGVHHRLGHQAADGLDRVPGVDAVTGDHGGGVGPGEAAREHAQAGEDPLLHRGEERVRPFDRGPEGLVTLDRAAATAGEQPEPLVEQGDDLVGVHAHDPRRRELDRERDAVEAPADLRDRPGIARVHGEARPRRRGAVDEQKGGVARRGVVGCVGR